MGAQQNSDPQYSTYEEAEAAFMKLLRRSNVQPDWAWEQAMRATIKDPQYRALKDPKDRKSAFEKYVIEVQIQEKDRAKERLAKLRTDFGTMLRSHPEIKHYTRWKTARPIIEGETIFRSTNDDTERRQLFEEYIIELKRVNTEREAVTRKSAMDELVDILKSLNLEPYTRWSEAQEVIQSNGLFQADDKFKTLSKSDILTAFENHMKTLERSFNDERQREKNSKQRRERQNRDNFLTLLRELGSTSQIKVGTRWMDILPLIQDDTRYLSLLGQPGSTPLDLFWDTVEEEERAFRPVKDDVYDVLDDKRFEVTPTTGISEFLHVMSLDRRTAPLSQDLLEIAFTRIQKKIHDSLEEDKHASEKQSRRHIESLRSRMKHWDRPAITVSTTWESFRPHIAHLEEFKALPNDELRRKAFDKVIQRIKDKEDDKDNERRSGKRDRDHRSDRDTRNGHSHRHGAPANDRYDRRRSSRTPELDAYEADRRKAMADRERQYHKSGSTGLSPSPRSRERPPRDGGSSRRPRASHYDRERREREDERERLYHSRADPRGSRDELDYGAGGSIGSGGGGGGGRRRGRGPESDGESIESGRKRARKDNRDTNTTTTTTTTTSSGRRREKTKTPEVEEKEVKEEVAMHSGSEEGEMVEDE